MKNGSKYSSIGWQHPKGLCYVSEKYKVIFVPIPKNASTSIRNIHEFGFHTSNIMSYEKALKEGEYRAFAIIREPIKRLLSGYIEVCARASGDSPHILSKDFYWEKGKERFYKFLDELEKELFDAHLFPQNYFLTDYRGKPFLIDTYIDIKYLTKMLPDVLDKYGVNLPAVPRLNVHGVKRSVGIANKFKRKIKIAYARRTLYYLMDYIVRTLQRKRIPNPAEVQDYIYGDKKLLHRIEALLESDIKFIEKIKKEMKNKSFGIY